MRSSARNVRGDNRHHRVSRRARRIGVGRPIARLIHTLARSLAVAPPRRRRLETGMAANSPITKRLSHLFTDINDVAR